MAYLSAKKISEKLQLLKEISELKILEDKLLLYYSFTCAAI